MVVGFGGRGELADKQLVPEKITAYRRFRFMPCTLDTVVHTDFIES